MMRCHNEDKKDYVIKNKLLQAFIFDEIVFFCAFTAGVNYIGRNVYRQS